VIVFPNCKINLGLRITHKRSDGYHDLETVFYPLPFFDVLEIIRKENFTFSMTGSAIDANLSDNLCARAYELLKNDHPSLPAVAIHLHKAIPSGAGLGGGSADAAFTLKLLKEKFGLSLTDDQLMSYALQLGSDCPFFIRNKPALATGRGEVLEEISLDLSAFQFIIVNPGIQISTAKAFEGIGPAVPSKSVKEIIQQPIGTWRNELINDFEKHVFKQYPEIASIKEQLYAHGAQYASMSGSGSTVFGIFKKSEVVKMNFPGRYFIKELNS
jgi:4-diphosphocytidyl-2-C-methyl-D-erythritol kinase